MLTETKVHEALENTFAHIVAESGEVVGGRNLIALVEKAGESAFTATLPTMLDAMKDALYSECGRAIMEWHSCSSAELGADWAHWVHWVDSWMETTYDIAQWCRLLNLK